MKLIHVPTLGTALCFGLALGASAAEPAPYAGAPDNWPASLNRPLSVGRHERFVKQARTGDIDLVFFGDSITDFWRVDGRGKAEWDRNYAALKAANFGVEGATTPEILWRVQNGELDGFKARVVVLMAGVSDLAHNASVPAVVDREAAIIAEVEKRQPQAKILLLAAFPRGYDADSPVRSRIRAMNAQLARLGDDKTVFYLDIGDTFTTADGTLNPEMMRDGLYPKGYAAWAEAMNPKLMALMR